MTQNNAAVSAEQPHLVREIGLREATALNMIDMIGVGPFITIPLIITAMHGPQAMLGWIFGALLAICDGLVWAELGAAMPGSGGSYRYLKEIYGANTLGRMLSFLFIWQLSFSAPLSIASGAVGLSRYASYLFPGIETTWVQHRFILGPLEVPVVFGGATLVAISVCVVGVVLLYRRINIVGAISKFLWMGVLGTIAWIIFAGLTNFDPKLAFSFPPGAFDLNQEFFLGFGAALLVATYDYWGYYNVCFFGEEVKQPERNIPRALLYSILAVAAIYIVMNIAILGVLPWQELDAAAKDEARFYIISTFMQRIYGDWAAMLVTVLIMWTAFASVFSLLLGYSRAPYAAALDGNYFKAFARVHPVHKFPQVSLLALGGVAIAFCFLRLADIIAALVVIRIMLQFLVQTVGLLILRARRPDFPRPFRMWLYPVPALLAILGFLYVLFSRKNFDKEIRYALVLLVVGLTIYLFRAWKNKEWPFTSVPAAQS